MNDEILCGVAYHPNFISEDEWENDLLLMKQSGINLIRTCELFNGWDQIERQESYFDFTIIEAFMDLCQRMEIKVMLGTGTASPPQWLKKIDPSIAIENIHGQHYPSDASYSWACPHNPTFEKYWRRYVAILVQQFRNHPALYAYQIHNEIGLPFMSQDGKVEVYCYCSHTKKAFQTWIEKKYKSLDALNASWTWSTSNPYYTSFEDVNPPSHMPKAWSSVTRWLDFRLFMMDEMTLFVDKQNRWIKKYDILHPTCVNTFFMKGEDKLGVLCAVDPFHLADVVDHIGFDLYPGSSNKEVKYPEYCSMFLDFARSCSYKHKGKFWMLETESGPINGWALGPHHNTNKYDICRNVIKNIGHNAKMELYMMFREYPFQPINWGGLVDLQGKKTDRLDMVKQLNECIQKYNLQSSSLRPRNSQVAILISRENAILCSGFAHEEFLVDSMRAHYQMFWRMGYQIDFITPEQKERFCRYRIISAPFMLTCDDEMLEALEVYVQRGGIVYGEPRFSFLDDKGWYQKNRPAKQLRKIFGLKHTSIQCTSPEETLCENGVKGYWHKEIIEEEGCDVLLYYKDKTSALLNHTYGKGASIYATSYFSLAALKYHDYTFLKVMKSYLTSKCIQPYITYSSDFEKRLDVQLLEDDRRIVLCIEQIPLDINKLCCVKTEVFYIRVDRLIHSATELLHDKKIIFQQVDKEVMLKVEMKPEESFLIELSFVI